MPFKKIYIFSDFLKTFIDNKVIKESLHPNLN